MEIFDMNGVLITDGCLVKVYQDDGVKLAVVMDDFTDNPRTSKHKGNWVDIDMGGGVEGMMSYILSVYNPYNIDTTVYDVDDKVNKGEVLKGVVSHTIDRSPIIDDDDITNR